MSFQLSNQSKQNREGIDHRLIEIDDLAITLTLIDYGHDKYAGKRTAGLQNELFHNGKSKCDGVSYISDHQIGLALDFYAYVDGKASWKHEHLAIVACAYFQAASIIGYELAWGGFYKKQKPEFINGIPYGWDMPHIRLVIKK